MTTTTNSKELNQALDEVRKIDRKIRRQYRYTCGIESLEPTEGKDDHYHGFFLSPDYQRADLLRELQNAGWRITHHEADYYWKAQKWDATGKSKTRIIFTYTEGDITLYQVDTTTSV